MAESGPSHSFPPPPPRAWQADLSRADAASYLSRVESWRSEVIGWLQAAATSDGRNDRRLPPSGTVSLTMCATLLCALGQPMSVTADLPVEFPLFPIGGDERSRVIQVLRWRGTIVDFFADVWDVIGEPLFDTPECAVATSLFMPPTPVGLTCCPYCLATWPDGSEREQHFQVCPFHNDQTPSWSRR